MAHKHCKEIKAWADGKEIQVCNVTEQEKKWRNYTDLEALTPNFNSLNYEWRIKPETLRYRVALMKSMTSSKHWVMAFEQDKTENDNDFVKWLTEWVEV